MKTIVICLALCGPHAVAHHKVETVMGLITIGATAAESVTSVNCLADMRKAGVTTSTCTKQGMFELKITPAFLAANHFARKRAPTPEAKYVPFFWLAPLVAFSIDQAYTNVNVSSVGYLRQTWGKR